MENAGELVTLGTDIVRLGGEMKEAQAELAAAQARVAKISAEMQPKLMRHAQLIQQAAGLAFPAPHQQPQFAAPAQPQPAVPLPPWAPPIANLIEDPAAPVMPASAVPTQSPPQPKQLSAEQQLKQRVKDYLKRRPPDDTVSAMDVAEVLRVDALLVREAMREMRTGR